VLPESSRGLFRCAPVSLVAVTVCSPSPCFVFAGAGNLTAANTIQNVIPVVETGDTQAVIYSLKPNAIDIYVANARAEDEQGPLQAYNRPFVHFDATALFAEQPPSAEAP